MAVFTAGEGEIRGTISQCRWFGDTSDEIPGLVILAIAN
jgi:hypothetical protein